MSWSRTFLLRLLGLPALLAQHATDPTAAAPHSTIFSPGALPSQVQPMSAAQEANLKCCICVPSCSAPAPASCCIGSEVSALLRAGGDTS